MRFLFGLLFVSTLSATALAGALAIHSDPAFSTPARTVLGPLLILFAGQMFLRRRPKKAKPRHGLLMSDVRPELSKGERDRMLNQTVYRCAVLAKSDLPDDHPSMVMAKEVEYLAEGWCGAHGGTLSDDEVRSLYQLWMYVDPVDKKTSRQPEMYLRDVANPEPFERLRKYVEDWRERPPDTERDLEDWLKHVGDPSANNMTINGWVLFLENLPGKDVTLWHSIATEFRDIEDRDRLDAAFWVLEQPACDRATASDFIRGMVYWGVLERLAENARDKQNWDYIVAYRDVIKRYNEGFYKSHAIIAASGGEPGPDFDTKAMGKMIARIVKKTGIPKLPRPDGLLLEPNTPTDELPKSYVAPYGYNADAGLFMKYPGPGWRNAS